MAREQLETSSSTKGSKTIVHPPRGVVSLDGKATLVLPRIKRRKELIRLGDAEKVLEVTSKVIWGQDSKAIYRFSRRPPSIKNDKSSEVRETFFRQAHSSWKSCGNDPAQLIPSVQRRSNKFRCSVTSYPLTLAMVRGNFDFRSFAMTRPN